MLSSGFGLGKLRISLPRSDPEGVNPEISTVLRFGVAAAAAAAAAQPRGPQSRSQGLVWALSISSTLAGEAGFGFPGWTPPWLAIWLVLVTLVWDAHRNILRGRINNLAKRRKFTASQMSSLTLINLFINSIIIY